MYAISGKTFIARSILRHLLWTGLDVELFDVSAYRRKVAGVQKGRFFHPDNAVFQQQRRKAAELALNDALEMLKGSLSIAILDGSHITRLKRRALCDQVAQSNLHCQVIFIESVCNDEELLRSLMKDTYIRSPDYANLSEEQAIADMSLKIQHFEREYAPMEPSEGLQYLKLIDLGRQIVTNEFHGYIPGNTFLCRSGFCSVECHTKTRGWCARPSHAAAGELARAAATHLDVATWRIAVQHSGLVHDLYNLRILA